MTEEEKQKLIKKWEQVLNVGITTNKTALLIEPIEIPIKKE